MTTQKYFSRKTLNIVFILILLSPFQDISAQLSKNTESSQFNFWIGKWELFTNGIKMGESKVDTILHNFAIQENFLEYPPNPFHGISLTSYNDDTKNGSRLW